MKKLTLVVLLVITGLYAQGIELVKIWEREISTEVKAGNVIFLDENGYNAFSVACKNPEKAIKNKRILIIEKDKIKWYEGDNVKLVKEINIKGKKVISKNGKNIAVFRVTEYTPDTIPPPEEPKLKGYLKSRAKRRGMIILLNNEGEELARGEINLSPFMTVHLKPLGNDKTVVVTKVDEDGTYYDISVFIKEGNVLKEYKIVEGGLYPTGVFDYAEDGSVAFGINQKDRLIIYPNGKIKKFTYHRQGWAGWVSPKGNYFVEVTRGKYLVIHDKYGNLIKEQKVQGPGNYYGIFSGDEKYLCLTPGPWKVYLWELKTGNLINEYIDSVSRFYSVGVLSSMPYVFVTKVDYKNPTNSPSKFLSLRFDSQRIKIEKESIITHKLVKNENELNFYIFSRIGAPPFKISSDERYIFLRLPSKIILYQIKTGGE